MNGFVSNFSYKVVHSLCVCQCVCDFCFTPTTCEVVCVERETESKEGKEKKGHNVLEINSSEGHSPMLSSSHKAELKNLRTYIYTGPDLMYVYVYMFQCLCVDIIKIVFCSIGSICLC